MRKLFILTVVLVLNSCCSINYIDKQEYQCLANKNICKNSVIELQNAVKNFHAEGGCFIVMNMNNHQILMASSVNNNYQTGYKYWSNNILKILNKKEKQTPMTFLTNYVEFVKNSDTQTLSILKNNILKGSAKNANIDGANVYGLTATDAKQAHSDCDEVNTTFLGNFTHDGQAYAILVLLDSPQKLKSTFGFNTSGWNATKLAGNIIKIIITGRKNDQ